MYSISIAILTYNRKAYLEECLRNLVRQTIGHMEIVIFDNGSDYDVAELASTISVPEGSTIKVERNEKNIGYINNSLKAQGYAFSSPYIMVFHDDDTLDPHYLDTAVRYLNANPEVAWVGSNMRFMHKGMDMDFFPPLRGLPFMKVDRAGALELIFHDLDLSFGSIVYKKEALRNTDLKSLWEKFGKWIDRPSIILCAGESPIGITWEKFVNYRVHESQDSSAKNDAAGTEKILSLFQFYKDNSDKSLSGKYLYYRWAFAGTISTADSFSSSLGEFFAFMQMSARRGYFKAFGVTPRGIYHFLRAVIRKSK